MSVERTWRMLNFLNIARNKFDISSKLSIDLSRTTFKSFNAFALLSKNYRTLNFFMKYTLLISFSTYYFDIYNHLSVSRDLNRFIYVDYLSFLYAGLKS